MLMCPLLCRDSPKNWASLVSVVCRSSSPLRHYRSALQVHVHTCSVLSVTLYVSLLACFAICVYGWGYSSVVSPDLLSVGKQFRKLVHTVVVRIGDGSCLQLYVQLTRYC